MCLKIVKKVFKAVLDRKRPFLHYQNIIMISDSLRTADAFPVVASLPPTTGNASAVRRLGIGQKCDISLSFFFSQIGRAKVFREVLNKKLPFLDHKNINIKDRKIRIFPKG